MTTKAKWVPPNPMRMVGRGLGWAGKPPPRDGATRHGIECGRRDQALRRRSKYKDTDYLVAALFVLVVIWIAKAEQRRICSNWRAGLPNVQTQIAAELFRGVWIAPPTGPPARSPVGTEND